MASRSTGAQKWFQEITKGLPEAWAPHPPATPLSRAFPRPLAPLSRHRFLLLCLLILAWIVQVSVVAFR
jgi:hypothetical protein